MTTDAYEPLLPLSVVVHIDYERAPSVIQRFGDVKKLITQTLDPMLSAYFRDIAHTKTMLELLHERDEIQQEARDELQQKFRVFDIECVDVLIGKPTSVEGDDKIETLLEQLRQRQLSTEQLETFERRKAGGQKAAGARTPPRRRPTCKRRSPTRRCRPALPKTTARRSWPVPASRPSRRSSWPRPQLGRSRREAEQKVVLAEADSRARCSPAAAKASA